MDLLQFLKKVIGFRLRRLRTLADLLMVSVGAHLSREHAS